MRSYLGALLALALLAPAVPAHFLFLLPGTDKEGKPTASLVFSDSLAADDNADLLDRVKHAEAYVRGADGKIKSVKHARADKVIAVELTGDGPRTVAVTCQYGVLQRGESEPFLLIYNARTAIGQKRKPAVRVDDKAVSELALDIVLNPADETAQVLWQGQPLAGAEVVLLIPGEENNATLTTQKDGTVKLPRAKATGLYGLRAKHSQKKEGKLGDKAYKEVRHYATCVFEAAAPGAKDQTSAVKEERKEDPAASKLLAEARAARANWVDFPGFKADLEINVDGKRVEGKLDVDARGKVTISGLDDEALTQWARRQLSSVVSHRLDGSANLKTACAFADDNAHHPLGRAVLILEDEFHSSYRIRDRQIMVVNRRMQGERFTITVIENTLNDQKQYLPRTYAVNTWDLKTEALKSSSSFHQSWVRVGQLDLPAGALVITSTSDGKQESRQITLSNHKLR